MIPSLISTALFEADPAAEDEETQKGWDRCDALLFRLGGVSEGMFFKI